MSERIPLTEEEYEKSLKDREKIRAREAKEREEIFRVRGNKTIKRKVR